MACALLSRSRMRRIGPGLVALVVVSLVAAFLARWLGWLDGRALLDVGIAVVGLVGLVALVKLPWDLYMQARALAADQRDARARGIAIDPEEERYAKRTEHRLLAACVALHLLTSLTLALATHFSRGELGYWFAAFYLLATFFRPAAAVYMHLRRRLLELRDRTRYPREDAVDLRARLDAVTSRLDGRDARDEDAHAELARALERLSRRLDALDHEHRARTNAFQDQVDRVLVELERTVDKLTEDREILSGIRAFVRAIKEA